MTPYEQNLIYNPGQSYQDAMKKSFNPSVANGGVKAVPTEYSTQAPGVEGEAYAAYQNAKNNADKQSRIQTIKEEMNSIKTKLAELKVRKEAVTKDLDTRMAANRARRIKKDNDAVEQWRWAREQKQKRDFADMQYRWQQGQNTNEKYLAEMTSRNEFNGALNSALSQWNTARKSGDALAEAYAKQNVDQLVALGEAKFGIDFTNKIKEFEDLTAKNAETARSQIIKEQELENEKRITSFETNDDVYKWNKKVMDAWFNKEIDDKQKNKLIYNDKSKSEELKDTITNTSLQLTAEQIKQRDAANKLTLDEFVSKIKKGDALNVFEESALKSQKIQKLVKEKYDSWKNATGERKKGLYEKYSTIFQKLGFNV